MFSQPERLVVLDHRQWRYLPPPTTPPRSRQSTCGNDHHWHKLHVLNMAITRNCARLLGFVEYSGSLLCSPQQNNYNYGHRREEKVSCDPIASELCCWEAVSGVTLNFDAPKSGEQASQGVQSWDLRLTLVSPAVGGQQSLISSPYTSFPSQSSCASSDPSWKERRKTQRLFTCTCVSICTQ